MTTLRYDVPYARRNGLQLNITPPPLPFPEILRLYPYAINTLEFNRSYPLPGTKGKKWKEEEGRETVVPSSGGKGEGNCRVEQKSKLVVELAGWLGDRVDVQLNTDGEEDV